MKDMKTHEGLRRARRFGLGLGFLKKSCLTRSHEDHEGALAGDVGFVLFAGSPLQPGFRPSACARSGPALQVNLIAVPSVAHCMNGFVSIRTDRSHNVGAQ